GRLVRGEAPPASLEEDAIVGAAERVPAVASLLVEIAGLTLVLGDAALAVLVEPAEHAAGVHIALVTHAAEELDGLRLVLGHAAAAPVEITEVATAIEVAAVAGLLE